MISSIASTMALLSFLATIVWFDALLIPEKVNYRHAPFLLKVASFDQYIEEAKSILKVKKFDFPVASVAAALLLRDQQKEVELIKKEMDMKIECLVAKSQQDISLISQR